ncbi:MAG: hypothetical protein K2X66_02500, partial [Cyanobacteria bacterium]|nr:hypothetical protein [Cyanobacteriota bacterium]
GISNPASPGGVPVQPVTQGALDSTDKVVAEIKNFNSKNPGGAGSPQGNASLAEFLNKRFPDSRFTVQGNELVYPVNGKNFVVDVNAAQPPRSA